MLFEGFGDADKERKRAAVDSWIRGWRRVRWRDRFRCGGARSATSIDATSQDTIKAIASILKDGGYKAMAESIDLGLLLVNNDNR